MTCWIRRYLFCGMTKRWVGSSCVLTDRAILKLDSFFRFQFNRKTVHSLPAQKTFGLRSGQLTSETESIEMAFWTPSMFRRRKRTKRLASCRSCFYDRDFADGTPVPLKRCFVPNWPSTSNAADITVFCKFTETRPSTSIPLNDWMKLSQNEWQVLDGFNGVRYKVVVDDNDGGDALIRVFEEHQASSAGLYSFRVDIGPFDTVRPSKVTRQFDAEHMMAVHTFHFKRADFDELRSGKVKATVDFTTKEALRSGAWKMVETSIQVRLFEEIGLLPVEAATGQR